MVSIIFFCVEYVIVLKFRVIINGYFVIYLPVIFRVVAILGSFLKCFLFLNTLRFH